MAQTTTGMIQRAGGWKGFQLRRAAAVAMAGMLGALPFALSPAASAHDVVLTSNPENGAVVEEFPETIELEFSGIPQDLFNTVALSNADSGDILYSGEPEIAERILSFDVPQDVERVPGNYTVGFQITSSDGHATKGSVSFEVAGGESDGDAAQAETTESATPVEDVDTTADEASESTGIAAPWNWVLGGVGVLVIAGAIVMMIAKNRNSK